MASEFNYDKFISGVRTCENYPDHSFHSRFRSMANAIPAGSRVLDIACGAGTLMKVLEEKGCVCTGMDLAPGAVKLARSKGLNVHHGDVDSFKENPEVAAILFAEYDYVIFSKCLIYLHSRNEMMPRLRTKHIFINQTNPYYWRTLIGKVKIGIAGKFLSADGVEMNVNSPGGLMRWGESYGYKARRLHGGWFRGKDMVIALTKTGAAAG